jgi:hypothetical protein
MSLVLGIDPGLHGALALYNTDVKCVTNTWDVPTYNTTINRKERVRVHAAAVSDMAAMFKMMGVTLAVIESVGGLPRQSASGAFVFGYATGLVYMALVCNKIPVDSISAPIWKKTMRVPGKGFSSPQTDRTINQIIIQRADEMMPDAGHLWRGAQGGLKVGRAEAAMIAKYGADYLLRVPKKGFVTEGRLAYDNVELGA